MKPDGNGMRPGTEAGQLGVPPQIALPYGPRGHTGVAGNLGWDPQLPKLPCVHRDA